MVDGGEHNGDVDTCRMKMIVMVVMLMRMIMLIIVMVDDDDVNGECTLMMNDGNCKVNENLILVKVIY